MRKSFSNGQKIEALPATKKAYCLGGIFGVCTDPSSGKKAVVIHDHRKAEVTDVNLNHLNTYPTLMDQTVAGGWVRMLRRKCAFPQQPLLLSTGKMTCNLPHHESEIRN